MKMKEMQMGQFAEITAGPHKLYAGAIVLRTHGKDPAPERFVVVRGNHAIRVGDFFQAEAGDLYEVEVKNVTVEVNIYPLIIPKVKPREIQFGKSYRLNPSTDIEDLKALKGRVVVVDSSSKSSPEAETYYHVMLDGTVVSVGVLASELEDLE